MRALVVGVGRMGGFHRRVLMDLGLDVTTVDPSPAAGADYLSVPQFCKPDVVCIAAPIDHLADEAARWEGHEGWLLIEKPGAPTADDARDLAYLLDGQRVAIGYVERFNPVVRRLRSLLATSSLAEADFTRWNDRPARDVALDLQSHDVDLAAFLGVTHAKFDARANSPVKRRAIAVRAAGRSLTVDLTAHDTSPLHAQWHAFLSGRPGYATPADAIGVLAALSGFPAEVAA